MSHQATTWAIEQQVVTDPTARHVLLCLANYAGPLGQDVYPSVATIAKDTGLGARTVQRKLQQLEDAGVLLPGNPAVVAAAISRADRRPAIYNLAMSAKQARGVTVTPGKAAIVDGDAVSINEASERHPVPNEVSHSHPVGGHGVSLSTERGVTDDTTGCHSDTQTVKDKQVKTKQNKPPTPLEIPKPKKPTRRKAAHEFNPAAAALDLPPNFNPELFEDFCARRLEIGKPMTLLALKHFVSRHEKHPAPVLDEMFRRAITSGWQDLFPLKPDDLAALAGSNQLGSAGSPNPADARAAADATNLLAAIRSRKNA